jgi:sugar phosphate permease
VPLASLGVFATAYYIGYVLSNAGAGALIDKLGGRFLISVSLIGAGIFMFAFGSTTSAAVGISVQGLIGLFAGAEYSAGIKLLASWFRQKELGKVMGVYTSATALGVLIANTAVPRIIKHFDWTMSYHVFGGISIVVGILCYIVLRPGPVFTAPPKHVDASQPRYTALIKNKDLVLLAVSGFGGFWGTYGFVIWSNALMVKGRGIPPTVAGTIVAIFAAMGVFGKPFIGWVSDKFNGARRVPAMVMLGLFSIMLIIFGFIDSAAGFYIAAPFLGLAAYCYLPMIVALVPHLVGSKLVGTAAGATNAFWQLGSVLVPMAVGTVFAATGQSFIAALATLAVGPVIGLVAMYFVNERPSKAEMVIGN